MHRWIKLVTSWQKSAVTAQKDVVPCQTDLIRAQELLLKVRWYIESVSEMTLDLVATNRFALPSRAASPSTALSTLRHTCPSHIWRSTNCGAPVITIGSISKIGKCQIAYDDWLKARATTKFYDGRTPSYRRAVLFSGNATCSTQAKLTKLTMSEDRAVT